MIGFGIDQIQAEYVAEIKLRHLNREYILKRLDEIENLEKEVAELESILESRRKVYNIIIKELEEVIKKYAKPRKTQIISANDAVLDEVEEPVDTSPVTLFFTKEGYFKKITPNSLRMSGEQKIKEGDEITQIIESDNAAELLFFTNKFQVYKSKVSEFSDSKASLLGDYVPARLEFEEGEVPVLMVETHDYTGFCVFIFDNGRISKVPLSSYATKTNRKKLINAYCNKFNLHSIIKVQEDCEILLTSTNGRMLLVHTGALAAKATKDNGGVAVMTQKKGQRIYSAELYVEGMLQKPHRYRTRNIPAAGSFKSADETAEQMSI